MDKPYYQELVEAHIGGIRRIYQEYERKLFS